MHCGCTKCQITDVSILGSFQAGSIYSTTGSNRVHRWFKAFEKSKLKAILVGQLNAHPVHCDVTNHRSCTFLNPVRFKTQGLTAFRQCINGIFLTHAKLCADLVEICGRCVFGPSCVPQADLPAAAASSYLYQFALLTFN
jgi:hypothetical protein